MQDHLEQHLDRLTKKVIKSPGLEKPSVDFTANIMAKLDGATSKAFVYKPLISKTGWVLIILLLIIASVYLIMTGTNESSILGAIDFSILSNNKLTQLFSGINLSSTVIYVIGIGGFMWFVQVSILKHYLDKRLEY